MPVNIDIIIILIYIVTIHGGAKPPLKCYMSAKFTYFLRFLLFVNQTCSMDYD